MKRINLIPALREHIAENCAPFISTEVALKYIDNWCQGSKAASPQERSVFEICEHVMRELDKDVNDAEL